MGLNEVNRSIVSPLRIDAVKVPGAGGEIGMTICPGKDENAGFGKGPGPWKRDLDMDLQVIKEWGANILVSLMEGFEFDLLSVPELPDKVRSRGIRWMHLPIVDVSVPDNLFEERWNTEGEELRQVLKEGGRIVIHCRGGLGRTGIIAARLLVEFGMRPVIVMAMVRRARPGTIQTLEQERYVLSCRP
jgi:ADP-ribosyl-[dinitrogen reductase] hydrolase